MLAQPPAHESNAAARCAVGLIQGLQSHGVEVRAVAARRPWAPTAEADPALSVDVIDVPIPEKRVGDRARKLRRPRDELSYGPLLQKVRDLADWADVIHLEQSETAWCGEALTTPTLVNLHYLVGFDRPLYTPWAEGWRDTVELALLERSIMRRHRFVAASSPRVAAELRRWAPTADVTVLPLTLDSAHYRPARPLDPIGGFIGTASWPPTASAARALVEMWPELRSCAPGASLRVAGRGMAPLLDGASGEGLRVEDEVPSAAAFIDSLGVLLYPLERGSGMKVKVLEALAAGVPVVTTEEGAEGIPDDPAVVVEGSREGFVSAAARLLNDRDERVRLGKSARETFFRSLSPAVITGPLIDLYERMIHQAGA